MGKNKKHTLEDLSDLYNDLVNKHIVDKPEYSNLKQYSGRRNFDPNSDDSEMFMTSSDIIKEEEKLLKKDDSRKIVIPGKIEESVTFKRYGTKRAHKYTEKEMETIRESCRTIIVHDYGEYDWYHLSDEERSRMDQLSEISAKIGRLKKSYTRVDQYIEAMRIVYEAWCLIYSKNHLHTREEFFEGVGQGWIVSNRIPFPILRGMSKYNMNKIIEYISNIKLDPSDLMEINDDFDIDTIDEDDYLSNEEHLLSLDELNYIIDYNPDEDNGILVKNLNKKYIEGYNDSYLFKKKKRKLNKIDRRIRKSTATILNKIQSGRQYDIQGHIHLATQNIFETKKDKSNNIDKYYGSWQDKTSLEIFDLSLHEKHMLEKSSVNNYNTNADVELNRFFKRLESTNINVIKLSRNVTGEGELGGSNRTLVAQNKELRKKNRKVEKDIIKRLNDLSNDPKFKKEIKKAEKAIDEYHQERINS